MDKNTTVVFPAPLMTTIAELGAFLARESAATTQTKPATIDTQNPVTKPVPVVTANGKVGAGTSTP